MPTVRDFKDFVNSNSLARGCGCFCSVSLRHSEFWGKLNLLGARNMAKIPPETVPDIDATVELSAQEWQDLLVEYNALWQ